MDIGYALDCASYTDAWLF